MTLEDRRRQALARLASRRPARTRPDRRPGWPPEPQSSGSPRSAADWETYLDDRDARIASLTARFLEPGDDEGDDQ